MRKTKKKVGARRARSARRFVKLTRAHLEMSGWLTDDEDKRYALTAICVRREGDAAVVDATNGYMAWRYPAEMVDGGELPETFAGKELANRERVLIDPGTIKQCLRALPMKSAPRESWKSAYLAVDKGVGVLSTISGVMIGASFRCHTNGSWPDFDEMIPDRGGPCVTLSAETLRRITTWASKFLYEDVNEKPLTLSFSPYRGVVCMRLDVDRAGGPVGALAPLRVHSGDMKASMPAWRAAFAVSGGSATEADATTEAAYPGLSATERKLLACLSSDARDIDDITAETELSPAEVSAGLLVLEIRKLARQLPGKKFVKVDRAVRKVVKRKRGKQA